MWSENMLIKMCVVTVIITSFLPTGWGGLEISELHF